MKAVKTIGTILSLIIFFLPVGIFIAFSIKHLQINKSFQTLEGNDFTYWR